MSRIVNFIYEVRTFIISDMTDYLVLKIRRKRCPLKYLKLTLILLFENFLSDKSIAAWSAKLILLYYLFQLSGWQE